MAEVIGICQWFHFGEHRQVEATVEALADLEVRHLRTGISWADYHRTGGIAWYDWQMRTLADAGIDLLMSVWHTPPSISLDPERGSTAVPPRRTRDYADFLDTIIDRWGDCFDDLELWNEPNNPYKWNPQYDPDHRLFASLIEDSAYWAAERGKRTVLGGVTHLDHEFADRMVGYGVHERVDIVGVHAFPDMWEPAATDWDHPDHWFGWEHRIETLSRAYDRPVWVTEVGLATVRKDGGPSREELQETNLLAAMEAPVERLYWYSMFDLDPKYLAIEEQNGGPREEAEYHMGLIRFDPDYRIDGREKPAYHALKAALTAP